MPAILSLRKNSTIKRRLEEIEAKIIALSCSEPPAGYSRWTLRLLEEKSNVVLGIELSHTTIGSVLKKNTP